MSIRGSHAVGKYLIILIMRRISLKRLMEGGAAIFAAERRNHHRAMYGKIIARPLEI